MLDQNLDHISTRARGRAQVLFYFILIIILWLYHRALVIRVTPFLCDILSYRDDFLRTLNGCLRKAKESLSSRREYKNMCLSLQSPWLRRDLHEKTKTCFRGVSSPFPRAFAAPVAFSPSALVQPRGAVFHTVLRYGTVCKRGAGKSWLSGTPSRRCFAFYNSKDIM